VIDARSVDSVDLIFQHNAHYYSRCRLQCSDLYVLFSGTVWRTGAIRNVQQSF